MDAVDGTNCFAQPKSPGVVKVGNRTYNLGEIVYWIKTKKSIWWPGCVFNTYTEASNCCLDTTPLREKKPVLDREDVVMFFFGWDYGKDLVVIVKDEENLKEFLSHEKECMVQDIQDQELHNHFLRAYAQARHFIERSAYDLRAYINKERLIKGSEPAVLDASTDSSQISTTNQINTLPASNSTNSVEPGIPKQKKSLSKKVDDVGIDEEHDIWNVLWNHLLSLDWTLCSHNGKEFYIIPGVSFPNFIPDQSLFDTKLKVCHFYLYKTLPDDASLYSQPLWELFWQFMSNKGWTFMEHVDQKLYCTPDAVFPYLIPGKNMFDSKAMAIEMELEGKCTIQATKSISQPKKNTKKKTGSKSSEVKAPTITRKLLDSDSEYASDDGSIDNQKAKTNSSPSSPMTKTWRKTWDDLMRDGWMSRVLGSKTYFLPPKSKGLRKGVPFIDFFRSKKEVLTHLKQLSESETRFEEDSTASDSSYLSENSYKPGNIWPRLRDMGWTYKRGSGTIDWYYIMPGYTLETATYRNGYLTSVDELMEYCRERKLFLKPSKMSSLKSAKTPKSTGKSGKASRKKILTKKTPKTITLLDTEDEVDHNEDDPNGIDDEEWEKTWEDLEEKGWHLKNKKDRMWYLRPGSNVANGIEGEDYFTSKKDVMKFLSLTGKLKASPKKSIEKIKTSSKKQPRKTTSKTPVSSKVKKKKYEKRVSVSPVTAPKPKERVILNWKSIWTILRKEHGWYAKPASGLATGYVYYRGGFDKNTAKLGEDYFMNAQDLMEYAVKNILHSDNEEDESMNSEEINEAIDKTVSSRDNKLKGRKRMLSDDLNENEKNHRMHKGHRINGFNERTKSTRRSSEIYEVSGNDESDDDKDDMYTWGNVWGYLRKKNWHAIKPSGLENHFCYAMPEYNKENGKVGTHLFYGEKELLKYAKTNSLLKDIAFEKNAKMMDKKMLSKEVEIDDKVDKSIDSKDKEMTVGYKFSSSDADPMIIDKGSNIPSESRSNISDKNISTVSKNDSVNTCSNNIEATESKEFKVPEEKMVITDAQNFNIESQELPASKTENLIDSEKTLSNTEDSTEHGMTGETKLVLNNASDEVSCESDIEPTQKANDPQSDCDESKSQDEVPTNDWNGELQEPLETQHKLVDSKKNVKEAEPLICTFEDVEPLLTKKTLNAANETNDPDETVSSSHVENVKNNPVDLDSRIIDHPVLESHEKNVDLADDPILEPKKPVISEKDNQEKQLAEPDEEPQRSSQDLVVPLSQELPKRAPIIKSSLLHERDQEMDQPSIEEPSDIIAYADCVLDQLDLSFTPRSIACREEERKIMMKFFKTCFENGQGSSMYISGRPGTGKSALMNELIEEHLPRLWTSTHPNLNSSMESPDLVNINAMHFSEPKEALLSIARTVCQLETSNIDEAMNQMNQYFQNSKKLTILVIDEMDGLLDGKKFQGNLSSLFLWAHSKSSSLVLVGIANSLELVRNHLTMIQDKGYSPVEITFSPYSRNELVEIMRERFVLEPPPSTTFRLVDEMVIDFCARKVAAVSGDVRLALDLCKRCLTSGISKRLATGGSGALCRLSDFVGIAKALLDSPHGRAIKELPRYAKLVLYSATKLPNQLNDAMSIHTFYSIFLKVCKEVGVAHSHSMEQFRSLCDLLSAQSLITVSGLMVTDDPRKQRMKFNLNKTDIQKALSGDDFLSSFVSK